MRTINEITGRATTIIKETAPMLSEDTDKAEKVRDHLVLSLMKIFKHNYYEVLLPEKKASMLKYNQRDRLAVLMPKDKNHDNLYEYISEYFLRDVEVRYFNKTTPDDILGDVMEVNCSVKVRYNYNSYFFNVNIDTWKRYLERSDEIIEDISEQLFNYILGERFINSYDLKEYNGKLSYIDYTLNMDEAREHYNNNKNTRYL